MGRVLVDMKCYEVKTEMKAMVMNRYNYLNTFCSKTPNGKKDAIKVTAPQSKHYKQKAKRTVSSKQNAKWLSKIKMHKKKKKKKKTCKDIQ